MPNDGNRNSQPDSAFSALGSATAVPQSLAVKTPTGLSEPQALTTAQRPAPVDAMGLNDFIRATILSSPPAFTGKSPTRLLSDYDRMVAGETVPRGIVDPTPMSISDFPPMIQPHIVRLFQLLDKRK